MKLRCPYCRRIFVFDKQTACPACGKVLVLPGALRASLGLKHEQKPVPSEHRRKRLVAAEPGTGRKPSTLVFMLMLMIVAGGMLIGRAHFAGAPPKGDRRETIARRELRVLRIALERYRNDCGMYPTTAEGLKALVLNPGTEAWRGTYITLLKPDPWHHRYVYRSDGVEQTLVCLGPDGVQGTSDDLVPPVPTEEEVTRSRRTP